MPNEKFRYPEDMPQGFRSPKEYGLLYEDVYITTKDNVKLHAWFIKAGKNPKHFRTLIFFHGNAGNIGSRLPNLHLLINSLSVNILILAYRGYGHSEGKPSEDGLKLDADATLEYLLTERDDIDKERIFVFGRSLGGAVATQLAISKPEGVNGIIVENTFTSLSDMVDALLPFLTPFKFLVQRIFYPTVDKIGKVKCPILFIRGLRDEIVPCQQSLVLYDKAKNARFK